MKTAPGQKGRVSKSITVTTDAGDAKTLRLRFTVEIYMPITGRPVFRFSMNAIEGNETRQRILIRRADGEPLEIRRTKVSQPGLTVHTGSSISESATDQAERKNATPTPWGAPTALPDIVPEPGEIWVELVADASLAAGRYSDAVRLATNHPEAPEIKIPYTVRIRPLIEARPSVVRMWTAQNLEDPGRSAIVTLRHYGDRKFTITAVEVSHPALFTATAYGETASTQQTVKTVLLATLDAATLGRRVEGHIRISTDDPERPQFDIPVLVAPSRTQSRRPVAGRK